MVIERKKRAGCLGSQPSLAFRACRLLSNYHVCAVVIRHLRILWRYAGQGRVGFAVPAWRWFVFAHCVVTKDAEDQQDPDEANGGPELDQLGTELDAHEDGDNQERLDQRDRESDYLIDNRS